MTGYKPLTTIICPKQGISPLVAACSQCWALILVVYTYDIVYRPTGADANTKIKIFAGEFR